MSTPAADSRRPPPTDCSACSHPADEHAVETSNAVCWLCTECPGYVEPEPPYDPAEDHNPIPGLTIRVHGHASA